MRWAAQSGLPLTVEASLGARAELGASSSSIDFAACVAATTKLSENQSGRLECLRVASRFGVELTKDFDATLLGDLKLSSGPFLNIPDRAGLSELAFGSLRKESFPSFEHGPGARLAFLIELDCRPAEPLFKPDGAPSWSKGFGRNDVHAIETGRAVLVRIDKLDLERILDSPLPSALRRGL